MAKPRTPARPFLHMSDAMAYAVGDLRRSGKARGDVMLAAFDRDLALCLLSGSARTQSYAAELRSDDHRRIYKVDLEADVTIGEIAASFESTPDGERFAAVRLVGLPLANFDGLSIERVDAIGTMLERVTLDMMKRSDQLRALAHNRSAARTAEESKDP